MTNSGKLYVCGNAAGGRIGKEPSNSDEEGSDKSDDGDEKNENKKGEDEKEEEKQEDLNEEGKGIERSLRDSRYR